MKIIYQNLLPVKGYRATMFFGAILARKEYKPLSECTINHEAIHKSQAKDCRGYIPYYALYLVYWIRRGYRNSPFEREAYGNQNDLDYLKTRIRKAWRAYK